MRAKDLIKQCEKSPEFESQRQNGSHVILTARNGRIVSIPNHTGDLARGTERSILKMMKLAGFLTAIVLALAFLLR